MTYFDIIQFITAFVALVVGIPLVWILAKMFRYKIWKIFFAIWKDILIVSFLVSIILIFVPFQFKNILIFLLLLVYWLLFRGFGPTAGQRKAEEIRITKIRRYIARKQGYLIFGGMMIVVILLGSGQSAIVAGAQEVDGQGTLLIGANGDFNYDYANDGNYGMLVSDEDGNGKYDTVKYDLNKDGLVDMVHSDQDEDGVVDNVQVIDYTKQKLLIIFFVLLSLIGIYFYGKKKKYLKWQLEYWSEPEEKDLKIPDSKTITSEEADEYEKLKKEAKEREEAEKTAEKEKFGEIPEEKEIPLKSVKCGVLSSKFFFRRFLLIFGDIGIIKILIKLKIYGKLGYTVGTNCIGPKSEVNNSKFRIQNSKLKKLFSVIGLFVFAFVSIFSNSVYAMTAEEAMMQASQSQECAKDPFNDSLCVGIDAEVRLFMQHSCNSEFQKGAIERAEKMKSMMYESQEAYLAAAKEYQTRWNAWKAKTPKPCTSDVSIGMDGEITKIEKKDDKYSWEGTGENFENKDVKTAFEEAKKKGTPDIDYFKLLDELLKYGKASTDTSGKLLEGINGLNKMEHTVVALFKEIRLNNKTPGLEKALKTIEGFKAQQLKVDDDIAKILDDLKKVKKSKDQNVAKYLEKMGVEKSKFSKTLKAFDILGKGVDIYSDARSFNKTLKGDPGKVAVATTLTTAGKWTLGANPVDVTTGLIGGVLTLAGKDKRGENVSSISAGDICKKTIEDAYTTTTDDFKLVVAYEAQESKKVWKDAQYNVVEKTGIQLNKVASVMYGGGVMGVQQVLKVGEPGIKMFNDGVKEIAKWLK